MKFSFTIFISIFFFSFLFCQDIEKLNYNESNYEELKIYKFNPSGETYQENPELLNINPNSNVDSVFDTLSIVLNSLDIFNKHNIVIEKTRIEKIKLPNKIFRIGVVNIVDPEKIAMRNHFQGSTGGHVTSLVISSNLIQPQLFDPILEGLIITYNGKASLFMDHINFDLIIPPSESRGAVNRAIRLSKK